jgi:hypothetical protein
MDRYEARSFVLRWMSGFLSNWFVAEVVVMVMVLRC